MRKLRDRIGPLEPEDYLRLATESHSPKAAGELARQGLLAPESKGGADPESELLLLRELFKSHVYARRPRSAHAVAKKMVRLGALPEVAHADLGRASASLGWFVRASQAYRLAARFAPAHRRALHWGACAAALHHAGRHDEALAALERAVRWSTTTRPLHRAHAALVQLDRGREVEDLAALTEELSEAKCGEGYGRYVLGLLAEARGDRVAAVGYLREFVTRNHGDLLKAATLTGELARARRVLRARRAGNE